MQTILRRLTIERCQYALTQVCALVHFLSEGEMDQQTLIPDIHALLALLNRDLESLRSEGLAGEDFSQISFSNSQNA